MKQTFLLSVFSLSAARAFAVLSQFFVLPILARTLSLEEFGTMALAMSVVIFANILSDGGMGKSLIRTSITRHAEWSSVFWVLCSLGGCLSASILLLAPVLVQYFKTPDLYHPLLVLSCIPFLLSVNAVFGAELEQRKAFTTLASASVIATILALVAAIGMALSGFGIWALVAQQVILTTVRLVWIVSFSRFRPDQQISLHLLKDHFVFGRDMLLETLVRTCREQVTPLIVGKVMGTAVLGIYSLTDRFINLPFNGFFAPFGQVLYVRLVAAREYQSVFVMIVLRALSLAGMIVIPAIAAVAMIGETLFTFILSDKWAMIAPLFTLAALEAAFKPVASLVLHALTARGDTTRRLIMICQSAVLWFFLLAISVGYGLYFIMIARSLWILLIIPIYAHHLKKSCNIRIREYLLAFVPGIYGAIVLIAGFLLIKKGFNPDKNNLLFISIVLWSLVMIGLYFIHKEFIRNTLRLLNGEAS